MSQQAVESALHGWLSSVTEMEVRIAEQDATQPAGDFCTYQVTVRRGSDFPAQERRLVPNAPPGQELEVTHSEVIFYTVLIQAYTRATVGDTAALEVLERVRKSAVLESVQRQLKEAGVAIFTRGTVRKLSALAGPRWEGRAALEVVVNVVEALVERTTYIETATVAVQQGG